MKKKGKIGKRGEKEMLFILRCLVLNMNKHDWHYLDKNKASIGTIKHEQKASKK